MTNPNVADVSDTSRPRPVRIFAFGTSLAGALLGVLSIALNMDPNLVGALSVVIATASMGGWLFVEQQVTPTSSPAAKRRDGTLVPLVRASGDRPTPLADDPEHPVPPVGFDH
jgi:hypothetical protein